MARLRTYTTDTAVTGTDRLLGTDAVGNGTRNFTVSDLAEFINTGVNITDNVWNGIIPTITQDGENIEISQVRTIHTSQSTAGTEFINNETGFSTILIPDLNDNDKARLAFTNYNTFYHLPSFVGKTFTAITNGANQMTYVGTIDSVFTYTDGRIFDIMPTTNASGVVIDYDVQVSFNVTLSENNAQLLLGQDTVDTLTINTSGLQVVETDIIGKINLDQLEVSGTSLFLGDITIGTLDDVTNPVNVNLHGALRLPTEESSIVFGQDEAPLDEVVFGVNNDGLTTSGDGKVQINNETTFSEDVTLSNGEQDGNPNLLIQGGDINLYEYLDADGNSVGGNIRTFSGLGVEGPQIEPTTGNGTAGEDQGLLTSLQVGDRNWHLPSATSSVAQVVPGLLEELSPATSTGQTTGEFFYGTDRGTFVEYNQVLGSVPIPSLASDLVSNTSSEFPDTAGDAITLSQLPILGTGITIIRIDLSGTEFTISSSAYTVNGRTITFTVAEDPAVYRAIRVSYTTLSSTATGSSTVSAISIPTNTRIPISNRLTNSQLLGAFSNIPTASERLFFVTTASATSVAIPNRITLTATTGALTNGFPFQAQVVVTDGTVTLNTATNELEITGATATQDNTIQQVGQNFIDIPNITDTDPLNNGYSVYYLLATGLVTDVNNTLIPTSNLSYTAGVASRRAINGDVVDGSVYEVTNYDAIDYNSVTGILDQVGQLEYSLIGQGNLQVNSSRFTIASSDVRVTNIPAASPTSQNLLFRDPISGVVTASSLTTVAGSQAQVRYCPAGEPDNLTNVSEIRFEGASAVGGVITVGGGRFSIPGGNTFLDSETGGVTGNTSVEIGDIAILGPITAVRVLRLPEGEIGASVRIINVSTFGTNTSATAIWTVVPDGSELITGNATLELNDRTANFDLVYVGSQLGWMIIQ